MKDFINQFRRDSKHLDEKSDAETNSPTNTPAKSQEVEIAKAMINAYRETYANVDLNVLRNLIELKDITSSPPEPPDAAAAEIEKRLGADESHETLRQERWHPGLYCPVCSSRNIKRLSEIEQQIKDNRKYQCQACQNIFTDESGTPLESGVPPLSAWMFCWYLLGCSSSIQYIALKLGLDISTVEYMVRQMQKLFKSEQPLKNFLTYDEWANTHGKAYKQRLEKEMAVKSVLYQEETSGVPFDTHLYRRKKDLHDPDKDPQRPKPKNRGG